MKDVQLTRKEIKLLVDEWAALDTAIRNVEAASISNIAARIDKLVQARHDFSAALWQIATQANLWLTKQGSEQ